MTTIEIDPRREAWIRDPDRHHESSKYIVGDRVRLNRRCADPFRGRVGTIRGKDRGMVCLIFEGERRMVWASPEMVSPAPDEAGGA